MGFVKDNQIPLAVLEKFRFVFGTFEGIHGCDGSRLQIPDTGIDGIEVPVEYLEESTELFLHLLLPLHREPGGTDDERPVCFASLQQGVPDDARSMVLPSPTSSARRNRRRSLFTTS